VEGVVGDFRLTQQYASIGRKPTGCEVLEAYQFRRSSAHQYRIEAVCSNTVYIVKTVDMGTEILLQFINPYRPSPAHRVQFYVLGRGTNAESVSSPTKIISFRVRNTQTGETNHIRITASGDIYVED
jgi:hypothetical protein